MKNVYDYDIHLFKFLGLVSSQKKMFKLFTSELSPKQNFMLIFPSYSITYLPLPHLKTKDRDRLDTESEIFHLIF